MSGPRFARTDLDPGPGPHPPGHSLTHFSATVRISRENPGILGRRAQTGLDRSGQRRYGVLVATLMELQTVWTGVAGSPYYTTLRAFHGNDLTPEAFSDAWDAALTARAVDFPTALTANIQAELRLIDSVTGTLVGTAPTDGNVFTGSSSGDPLPRASQALIRWSTPAIVAGRRLRGRTFLPCIIESFNTSGGKVDSSLVTAWRGVLDDFISDCQGELCVWSPTHGSVASVEVGTLWDEWAVMRSRRD